MAEIKRGERNQNFHLVKIGHKVLLLYHCSPLNRAPPGVLDQHIVTKITCRSRGAAMEEEKPVNFKNLTSREYQGHKKKVKITKKIQSLFVPFVLLKP